MLLTKIKHSASVMTGRARVRIPPKADIRKFVPPHHSKILPMVDFACLSHRPRGSLALAFHIVDPPDGRGTQRVLVQYEQACPELVEGLSRARRRVTVRGTTPRSRGWWCYLGIGNRATSATFGTFRDPNFPSISRYFHGFDANWSRTGVSGHHGADPISRPVFMPLDH